MRAKGMNSRRTQTLHVTNMVCSRCIASVENTLTSLKIPFTRVDIGEIELSKGITGSALIKLEDELKKAGFGLLGTRLGAIVEKIKTLVQDHLAATQGNDRQADLRSFITSHINYDHDWLCEIFSSMKGVTIEQFYLIRQAEKVKELLVYAELSPKEMAGLFGYSSVHQLSSRFKKVTGLTPSHFKKIADNKRSR